MAGGQSVPLVQMIAMLLQVAPKSESNKSVEGCNEIRCELSVQHVTVLHLVYVFLFCITDWPQCPAGFTEYHLTDYS